MYIRKKRKLIQGVGINDADYKISDCPYYSVWVDMIRRACDDQYKTKMPTYKDVTVCEEWKRFSIFKKWMEKQDWQGKTLDKDLLKPGNKVYSPDACCFLTDNANKFFAVKRGHEDKLTCVRYPEKDKDNPIRNCIMSRKYGCDRPMTARIFDTAEEAFLHYAKHRLDRLIIHSKDHDDPKVSQALIDNGLFLLIKARLLVGGESARFLVSHDCAY